MAWDEGHIATTIGAVVGAITAALVVAGLAMILAPPDNEMCDDIECYIDQNVFPLVAQATHAAMAVGSGAGTWLALRLRNQSRAGRTAAIVVALYLASGYLLAFFALVVLLIFLMLLPAGTTTATIAIGLTLLAAALVALIGCPLVARHLAVR